MIEFYGTPDAVATMLKLAKIGIKAHQVNPSPVDIKEQLADLPIDMLLQLEEDLTRVHLQNQPAKNNSNVYRRN